MAEILDDYEFPEHRKRSKYDWELWLDGKIHKLSRGTAEEVRKGKADFTAPVEVVRKAAQTYLSEHKSQFLMLEWDEADINTLILRAVRVQGNAVTFGTRASVPESGYEIRYADGGILTTDFRKNKTDALEVASKLSGTHDDVPVEVWRAYQGNLTRKTATFVNGEYK